MKFKLHDAKKLHGRLGCISDVERLPSFKLETPNLLFYAKRGCIPHLTHEVMQMLTTDTLPLQIPLDSIHQTLPALEESNMSLDAFIGLPEYFSYCVVQDPSKTNLPNQHRSGFATLWTRTGRTHIAHDSYMEHMETCKPDMYVSLCDGETNPSSGYKRSHNAVMFTRNMFKYCFEKHQSSPVLKNKGLIAPLEGAYNLSLREECAKFMADFPVLGYLVDGLYTDCKTVPSISHESIENILLHSLPFLPEDRLRIVHGPWEPELVLKMIKSGVDLFDTTFPHIAADNGCALIFNYNVSNLFHSNTELYDHALYPKDVAKEAKSTEDESENLPENNEKFLYKNPYSISLHDKKYFDDFSPLLEGCDCLTCRKHTKTYIHHLLCTKELLAPLLLTLHNLHHYMKFFQKIREDLHTVEVQNNEPVK